MSVARAIPPQMKLEPTAETLARALQHVDKLGSLLRFVPDRVDRLALTKELLERGLIAWNKSGGAYLLTAAGHNQLKQPKAAAAQRRVEA
jgi:hypothetical protein